MTTDV